MNTETRGRRAVRPDVALPSADAEDSWPRQVYDVLREADVRHMAYVPDAGHAELIELFRGDRAVTCNVLTTEEEGIALAAGAWLGGQRSVLLMQSSGVGNCINMLSLPVMSRFPFLTVVTMRGEWAELNPWQVPMGLAAAASLEAIGLRVIRAETPGHLVDAVRSATMLSYECDQQIAILISQRLLGRKKW
jgi:sulfopyruvate decarboxylase TPP-binding subunit